MSRLIDADKFFMKAYNASYPVIHGNNDRENGLTMYGIAQLLDEQPTIDAAPVVHGHWIGKPLAGYSTVKCSACGSAFVENNGKWKYCPDCGAKMDEVTE